MGGGDRGDSMGCGDVAACGDPTGCNQPMGAGDRMGSGDETTPLVLAILRLMATPRPLVDVRPQSDPTSTKFTG